MIPIPGHPDYFVNGTDIVSLKWGKIRIKAYDINPVTGYAIVHLYNNSKRTALYVHRILAEVYKVEGFEEPGKIEVDHIDRNITNNDPSNLRWVSPATQASNRSMYANKKTKGWYIDRCGKYVVRVMTNYKYKIIGRYKTEEDANAAYLEAKKIHHPAFTS